MRSEPLLMQEIDMGGNPALGSRAQWLGAPGRGHPRPGRGDAELQSSAMTLTSAILEAVG